MKYRILDLFCGGGGCSVGYSRAGFEVVGVDAEPHEDYPFEIVVADAMEVLADVQCLSQFDAVAASPPCPRYSTITREAARENHPDLIPPVRDALRTWGGTYVIENVPGAKRHLDHPIQVCGSWFGLRVRRHRLFESNVPLLRGTDCLHRSQGTPVGVYGHHGDSREFLRPNGTRRGARAGTVGQAQAAMGIDWMTQWDDLTDAIPPAYTEHIGLQLIDHLKSQEAAA